MQIANPNLIIGAKALEERMNRNPESPLEEIFKFYDLTWPGIWVAFVFQRAPSAELFVVNHPNGDEIIDGVLVAS